MVGDDERQFDTALFGALADHHPTGSEGYQRFVETPRPAILKGGGRADDDGT
ncbi:hypothetical protein D3C78_1993750 [compost metagenome]